MRFKEQSLIRIVAKISLWATPIPSSYFVARASVKSLQVESPFHIIIAGVVELLGVSAVHVFLWIYTWNRNNVTDGGFTPGIEIMSQMQATPSKSIESLSLLHHA
jgi:hypothetical protein